MAIVVTEVDGRDLLLLQSMVQGAVDQNQSIKISQHTNGTIMVKRGGDIWVAPFGKDVTER